ncbi:hypothetical protein [Paraburkholderia atlantica]|uniref:hypothetical protein n=1 Tax=Paraburkholderia atlantica TaxID=2654982 RepID=UPI00160F9008|nr:hypothetical protein [Paraburkholderia atlantica]MBB5511140.1 hypothetical protein [Paraburkholderia atlantica]
MKHPDLKALIKVDGQHGTCDICKQKGWVQTSANNRFFQLCKALVRFNYNEWDYNDHWGGDGLERLFWGPENIFFNEERAVVPGDYEDLYLDATQFGEVYEDYDKGVTVFAGYSNGHQNLLLRSIKSTLDPALIEMSQRLKTENHFSLESELKGILETFIPVASRKIEIGEKFFRARVGFKER